MKFFGLIIGMALASVASKEYNKKVIAFFQSFLARRPLAGRAELLRTAFVTKMEVFYRLRRKFIEDMTVN